MQNKFHRLKYSQEYYQKKIDAGKCTNCQRLAIAPYKSCEECRAYRDRRRIELNKQGLCHRHRLPILFPYKGRCQKCVDSWRLRVWKLTPEAYAEKKRVQENKCAICKREFVGEPSIDHNHKCCDYQAQKGDITPCGKCTRDLLCDMCNHGLGSFMDNPEILRAAADYIERWKGKGN